MITEKKEVKIKYIYGFDVNINTIEHPRVEPYREPIENKEKKYDQLRERWVIKLDKDYYIWQWSSNEKGKSLKKSEVFNIYEAIMKSIDETVLSTERNIFMVEDIPNDNRIIPVIYQPAIDS